MLKQNGVLLAQMPMRQFGGAINSETRTMWRSSFNMFAGGINKNGGYPNGHLAPSAWMLPQKAGSLSAYTSTFGNGSAVANGAMGISATGSASGDSIASAVGNLIVSAFGTALGSGATTGNVIAALFGSGSASGNSAPSAVIGALAWALGSAQGAGSAALTSYAVGFMSGTTLAESGQITADEIAMAVHRYIVESGMSFEEMMRVQFAVLAGKVSGAGTNTEVFRDIADSKARLTVTADEFGNRTSIISDGS